MNCIMVIIEIKLWILWINILMGRIWPNQRNLRKWLSKIRIHYSNMLMNLLCISKDKNRSVLLHQFRWISNLLLTMRQYCIKIMSIKSIKLQIKNIIIWLQSWTWQLPLMNLFKKLTKGQMEYKELKKTWLTKRMILLEQSRLQWVIKNSRVKRK